MKKLAIATILIVTVSLSTFAQTDTTYFDISWKKCTKDYAMFFRTIVPIKTSNLLLVSDFYRHNRKPQMIAECTSVDPIVINGKCTYFGLNGEKTSTGNYVNHKKIGLWYYWENFNTDSTIIEHLVDGSQKTIYTANPADEVYFFADVMPTFPGPSDAFKNYVDTHLELTPTDKEQKVKGTAIVSLTINKDGKIIQSSIVKSVSKTSDEALLKLINNMPNWKPGKLNGRAVTVQFIIPIHIK